MGAVPRQRAQTYSTANQGGATKPVNREKQIMALAKAVIAGEADPKDNIRFGRGDFEMISDGGKEAIAKTLTA
jgi:hypothetical protein